MNVTNIELSKELYELSGWEDGARLPWYCWVEAHQTYDIDNGVPKFPAYDLGFLLRKLPSSIHVYRTKSGEGRATGHDSPPNFITTVKGDTPEDATAKVAIELFKQGILSKAGDE